LTFYIKGVFHIKASTLGTPSKVIIILLHAVGLHDSPDGRIDAITRHVSFAQITYRFNDK